MSIRGWANALRDAFRSMTQSGLMSLASTLSVAISLLVLAVIMLLAVNLEFMATSVEQQVEIQTFLCAANREEAQCNKQELTEEQKQSIVAQIRTLANVKQAEYVTRHQALEQLKQSDPTKAEVLQGFEGAENPLSDEVYVKVVEVEQVKSVAEAIQAIPGVAKVQYGQGDVEKLLVMTHAIRIGGFGLVILLGVATILTLSNTIRLSVYARRREISIMKLVGATDWYIRRPFMLEGVFLGILGAGIASVITTYGYNRLIPYLQQTTPFLPLVQPANVITNMTLSLLTLGAVLGAFGSLISLRRFLKV